MYILVLKVLNFINFNSFQDVIMIQDNKIDNNVNHLELVIKNHHVRYNNLIYLRIIGTISSNSPDYQNGIHQMYMRPSSSWFVASAISLRT